MNRRAELPWELTIAPFDVREARRLGVSRSRLAGRDLARPYRGIRSVVPGAIDLLDRCHAYGPRMPRRAAFSHVTAALLQGVPIPFRHERDSRLHVLVPAPHRSPQMKGIVGHEWRASDIDTTMAYGLPVTAPALTWIQLGELLTEKELVAAGDFLVSTTRERPVPLATVAELRTTIAASAGRRGIRRLRTALDRVRTGVESPKETESRLVIVDSGFPEPTTNFTLFDSRGRHVARLDLAYVEYRVGLDYEGDVHRTKRRQFRKDITRHEDIVDQGWRHIRLTDDDLADGASALRRRLDRNLRTRGWHGRAE